MIYASKVILLPLKGMILRVTSPKVPRYGIMAIFPRYLETLIKLFLSSLLMHVLPLSSRGVSMSHSVSCSIFEKINPSIVFFLSSSRGWRSRKQRRQGQCDAMNQHPWERHLDREDCVSLCPSVFLTHDLNLGTRFLFSRGELSHP